MLPVTGCLRSFRNLGRVCVLDLYAGETYAPVWMSGGDLETVPPKQLFPPCCVVVLPSATVAQVRGGSRRRGRTGNGHSSSGTLVARKVDSSPGEKCAAELRFPTGEPYPRREVRGRTGLSPGEPYPGREVRGRTGLYKAGLGGWANSVCLGSDWVTPLRTSPQTCTGLLMTDFAVSTAVRRAGSLPVCLCYSSLGRISQQAQPDEVLTVPTVFFSSMGPSVDCARRGLPLL